jgi:pimeloyl-ACP methyl ester carboxylesterase
MENAGTGRTLSINGIDQYVEIHGQGEPLLLLHGFTGCGGDWRHVFDLDELARRHRLIVPDARGHGRSTNPPGTFSHRQCALDLAALLDQLGVTGARAIGMSLGGNTLLHLATQEAAGVGPGGDPDGDGTAARAPRRRRIEAMVLVSATMYYPAEARAVMRAAGAMDHPPEEWESMRQRHRHGDDQIRALWRQTGRFADSYDDMTFTPPHLATIAARTLIVYGDRDPLYPVEMAVAMLRAIPGAQLRVVPDAGHGPIFTGRARAQFADDALAFLAPG